MAPRRGAPSSSSLSPQDSATSNSSSSSPAYLSAPRSTSPSGLTQFLSKPAKWFTRSASVPKVTPAASEPRISTGSTGRKHKISRPTDPRPILDTYARGASRSVLDLSARPQGSLDIPALPSPGSPSSLTHSSSAGLGDLRNIGRRAWSKSADDLTNISTPNLSPINTSFQEKVAQYRNRSDSNASGISPSTPSSPASIVNGRQPFPTLKPNNPTSTSPTRSSTLPPAPGLSASVSAMGTDKDYTYRNANISHVHTRSQSFTPKLSSKLAPRFGPPSPIRKGFNSSERDVTLKDPERSGASHSVFSLGPSLSGKPSSQDTGPSNTSASTVAPSTTLLDPPMIIEPKEETDDSVDLKRSSQIVYHSGFINRLTDSSGNLFQYANYGNYTSATLAKGWKPFKLELKGSKLYFYKPPSDRNTAIKDLFPTQLIPAAEDELEDSTEDVIDANDKSFATNGREEGMMGRRRRAYWGRRTHPDLVVGDKGKVKRGSMEALIHEAVFATTFSRDLEQPEISQQNSQLIGEHQEDWRDLVVSVLLWLPSITGKAKFETEFMRCCSYLVSGAVDTERERLQGRVTWLTGEYLKCHNEPANLTAWDEWRVETIPNAPSAIIHRQNTMPTSSSMQALYASSPTLGHASPALGTFSPRPDANKMMSLMDALGAPLPPTSPSKSETQAPHSAVSQHKWVALEAEGLSRSVLLSFDPYLLARSLTYFHRSMLESIPEPLTADSIVSLDFTHDSLVHLFGSNDHPHWLTKLILLQILGSDSASGSSLARSLGTSIGRPSDDRNIQTSRTHSRSEVISVWARVAELCRISGDECSWQAIAAALCSRPVARLEKAWKRVDPHALVAIECWIYPSKDGECASVSEPKVTPWGGDVVQHIRDTLKKAKATDGDENWQAETLNQARMMFEGLRTSFSLCPRRVGLANDEIDDDVKRMVSVWRDAAVQRGGSGGLASKLLRIDQFMSLSLAAEAKRKGLFEPYFWSRSPSAYGPHAVLIPLLFPEPLPTVSLVDRGQIPRTRLDSDASDIQFLREPFLRLDDTRPDAQSEMRVGWDFTDVNRSGTVIPVYNGDLLLVVQPARDTTIGSHPSSRAPSRPPSSVVDVPVTEKTFSRSPSIRVKPGSSQGLERKTSVARRNSLPAISRRQDITVSQPSSEPPLRVAVQASTLSILVGILVHGLGKVTVSVADDNGEMSLREGKTRELFLDHNEFHAVWWNVFRSFITPLVFFELLRKLWVAYLPQGSASADYLQAINKRTELLHTMKEWITAGGGAQDILDDSQLYSAICTFFSSSLDHTIPDIALHEDQEVQAAWQVFNHEKNSLFQLLTQQTKRPSNKDPASAPQSQGVSGARLRTLTSRDPPDIDRISVEELVENLDGMACAAFSNVTEEDLFITSDLLEVQTADRTAWFPPKEVSPSEDATEIQTIYSLLQDVEASPMVSGLASDIIYRLLPPGIRSCIRAYSILRKWLIAQIVAPRLGIRARQARMELLLQTIEEARSRSPCPPRMSYLSLVERPCIRTFVEAVIISAILSMESRMHYRAWQNVAISRGTQCDSLAAFLSKPLAPAPTNRNKDPLTVDMGWLLERMIEILASPDVVDPSVTAGESLVNFDKRRHLCGLIMGVPTVPSYQRDRQRHEMIRRGLERLNNIEREVTVLQFDQRSIRDEALREAAQAALPSSAAKKLARPFQRLVVTQLEKYRRDKNLRHRLQKEKMNEQSRIEKREDFLNKAIRPRKPPPPAQKQHRNKKSMSAFLQFMRPISSTFGAEMQPTAPRKTPSELDFTPSGKPSLVLSLIDARISQFINTERSFTFQLDTEDGGHYLLQAINKRDMNKWIQTISRITKLAAKRRLTYLGSSPKPQVSDHIYSQPRSSTRDPSAVFGVELEFLLRREANGKNPQPGVIPRVIEQCLQEIESRGLTEVGIYRIAGANSETNALKEAFNRGECPIQLGTDIHAVCDLVKTWFRLLPQPVFPSSSYFDIMDAMKLDNLDARLSRIREVVQGLPQANFDLLRRVAEHLDKVTDFEEQNQMTAEALAIVFSPNLLRAPQNDFVMILANMGYTHKLVKALITHFHVILGETDPEFDGDQEEYDSPIPEEDEEESSRYPLTEPSPQLDSDHGL